jgi:hypothetical protein
MLAQTVEGAPATIPGAGDGQIGTPGFLMLSPEVADSWDLGEDDEISVMRILWDIYDPANEATDRVELGYEDLFTMLDQNDITTLDEFWDQLGAVAIADDEQRIDQGAIFQDHHVSPQPTGMRINGNLVNTWNPGDPIPSFEFRVPLASDHNTELLNQFGFKFFNSSQNEIFDTRDSTIFLPIHPRPETDPHVIAWTPSITEWNNLLLWDGAKSWTVYGSDAFPSSTIITGAYYSDASAFTTP